MSFEGITFAVFCILGCFGVCRVGCTRSATCVGWLSVVYTFVLVALKRGKPAVIGDLY